MKLLGLSGHLETSATGHFETFHRSLFEAFREILGDDNCVFLGSKTSSNDWFQADIPNSFTSTISWLPKSFLRALSKKLENSNSKTIIYIYEGNLASLFLLGGILRKNSNAYLYFNLFNSVKHLKLLRSSISSCIFRKLIIIATRNLDARIFITVDSKRFGRVVEEKIGKKVGEFPIYSCLQSDEIKHNRSRILINLRGSKSEKFLASALQDNKELEKMNLDIHGLHDEELVSQISSFKNCRLLSNHVDYRAYSDSCFEYLRVAFIYDPEIFAYQSSGRLADAIMANSQIVVPENTALADVLLEYGNGSLFEFGNVRSFVSALTSQPYIPKRANHLPSNYRSAQSILESIRSLEDGSITKIRGVQGLLNLMLDEVIRATLFLLRLYFGGIRRIRETLIKCREAR